MKGTRRKGTKRSPATISPQNHHRYRSTKSPHDNQSVLVDLGVGASSIQSFSTSGSQNSPRTISRGISYSSGVRGGASSAVSRRGYSDISSQTTHCESITTSVFQRTQISSPLSQSRRFMSNPSHKEDASDPHHEQISPHNDSITIQKPIISHPHHHKDIHLTKERPDAASGHEKPQIHASKPQAMHSQISPLQRTSPSASSKPTDVSSAQLKLKESIQKQSIATQPTSKAAASDQLDVDIGALNPSLLARTLYQQVNESQNGDTMHHQHHQQQQQQSTQQPGRDLSSVFLDDLQSLRLYTPAHAIVPLNPHRATALEEMNINFPIPLSSDLQFWKRIPFFPRINLRGSELPLSQPLRCTLTLRVRAKKPDNPSLPLNAEASAAEQTEAMLTRLETALVERGFLKDPEQFYVTYNIQPTRDDPSLFTSEVSFNAALPLDYLFPEVMVSRKHIKRKVSIRWNRFVDSLARKTQLPRIELERGVTIDLSGNIEFTSYLKDLLLNKYNIIPHNILDDILSVVQQFRPTERDRRLLEAKSIEDIQSLSPPVAYNSNFTTDCLRYLLASEIQGTKEKVTSTLLMAQSTASSTLSGNIFSDVMDHSERKSTQNHPPMDLHSRLVRERQPTSSSSSSSSSSSHDMPSTGNPQTLQSSGGNSIELLKANVYPHAMSAEEYGALGATKKHGSIAVRLQNELFNQFSKVDSPTSSQSHLPSDGSTSSTTAIDSTQSDSASGQSESITRKSLLSPESPLTTLLKKPNKWKSIVSYFKLSPVIQSNDVLSHEVQARFLRSARQHLTNIRQAQSQVRQLSKQFHLLQATKKHLLSAMRKDTTDTNGAKAKQHDQDEDEEQDQLVTDGHGMNASIEDEGIDSTTASLEEKQRALERLMQEEEALKQTISHHSERLQRMIGKSPQTDDKKPFADGTDEDMFMSDLLGGSVHSNSTQTQRSKQTASSSSSSSKHDNKQPDHLSHTPILESTLRRKATVTVGIPLHNSFLSYLQQLRAVDSSFSTLFDSFQEVLGKADPHQGIHAPVGFQSARNLTVGDLLAWTDHVSKGSSPSQSNLPDSTNQDEPHAHHFYAKTVSLHLFEMMEYLLVRIPPALSGEPEVLRLRNLLHMSNPTQNTVLSKGDMYRVSVDYRRDILTIPGVPQYVTEQEAQTELNRYQQDYEQSQQDQLQGKPLTNKVVSPPPPHVALYSPVITPAERDITLKFPSETSYTDTWQPVVEPDSTQGGQQHPQTEGNTNSPSLHDDLDRYTAHLAYELRRVQLEKQQQETSPLFGVYPDRSLPVLERRRKASPTDSMSSAESDDEYSASILHVDVDQQLDKILVSNATQLKAHLSSQGDDFHGKPDEQQQQQQRQHDNINQDLVPLQPTKAQIPTLYRRKLINVLLPTTHDHVMALFQQFNTQQTQYMNYLRRLSTLPNFSKQQFYRSKVSLAHHLMRPGVESNHVATLIRTEAAADQLRVAYDLLHTLPPTTPAHQAMDSLLLHAGLITSSSHAQLTGETVCGEASPHPLLRRIRDSTGGYTEVVSLPPMNQDQRITLLTQFIEIIPSNYDFISQFLALMAGQTVTFGALHRRSSSVRTIHNQRRPLPLVVDVAIEKTPDKIYDESGCIFLYKDNPVVQLLAMLSQSSPDQFVTKVAHVSGLLGAQSTARAELDRLKEGHRAKYRKYQDSVKQQANVTTLQHTRVRELDHGMSKPQPSSLLATEYPFTLTVRRMISDEEFVNLRAYLATLHHNVDAIMSFLKWCIQNNTPPAPYVLSAIMSFCARLDTSDNTSPTAKPTRLSRSKQKSRQAQKLRQESSSLLDLIFELIRFFNDESSYPDLITTQVSQATRHSVLHIQNIYHDLDIFSTDAVRDQFRQFFAANTPIQILRAVETAIKLRPVYHDLMRGYAPQTVHEFLTRLCATQNAAYAFYSTSVFKHDLRSSHWKSRCPQLVETIDAIHRHHVLLPPLYLSRVLDFLLDMSQSTTTNQYRYHDHMLMPIMSFIFTHLSPITMSHDDLLLNTGNTKQFLDSETVDVLKPQLYASPLLSAETSTLLRVVDYLFELKQYELVKILVCHLVPMYLPADSLLSLTNDTNVLKFFTKPQSYEDDLSGDDDDDVLDSEEEHNRDLDALFNAPTKYIDGLSELSTDDETTSTGDENSATPLEKITSDHNEEKPKDTPPSALKTTTLGEDPREKPSDSQHDAGTDEHPLLQDVTEGEPTPKAYRHKTNKYSQLYTYIHGSTPVDEDPSLSSLLYTDTPESQAAPTSFHPTLVKSAHTFKTILSHVFTRFNEIEGHIAPVLLDTYQITVDRSEPHQLYHHPYDQFGVFDSSVVEKISAHDIFKLRSHQLHTLQVMTYLLRVDRFCRDSFDIGKLVAASARPWVAGMGALVHANHFNAKHQIFTEDLKQVISSQLGDSTLDTSKHSSLNDTHFHFDPDHALLDKYPLQKIQSYIEALSSRHHKGSTDGEGQSEEQIAPPHALREGLLSLSYRDLTINYTIPQYLVDLYITPRYNVSQYLLSMEQYRALTGLFNSLVDPQALNLDPNTPSILNSAQAFPVPIRRSILNEITRHRKFVDNTRLPLHVQDFILQHSHRSFAQYYHNSRKIEETNTAESMIMNENQQKHSTEAEHATPLRSLKQATQLPNYKTIGLSHPSLTTMLLPQLHAALDNGEYAQYLALVYQIYLDSPKSTTIQDQFVMRALDQLQTKPSVGNPNDLPSLLHAGGSTLSSYQHEFVSNLQTDGKGGSGLTLPLFLSSHFIKHGIPSLSNTTTQQGESSTLQKKLGVNILSTPSMSTTILELHTRYAMDMISFTATMYQLLFDDYHKAIKNQFTGVEADIDDLHTAATTAPTSRNRRRSQVVYQSFEHYVRTIFDTHHTTAWTYEDTGNADTTNISDHGDGGSAGPQLLEKMLSPRSLQNLRREKSYQVSRALLDYLQLKGTTNHDENDAMAHASHDHTPDQQSSTDSQASKQSGKYFTQKPIIEANQLQNTFFPNDVPSVLPHSQPFNEKIIRMSRKQYLKLQTSDQIQHNPPPFIVSNNTSYDLRIDRTDAPQLSSFMMQASRQIESNSILFGQSLNMFLRSVLQDQRVLYMLDHDITLQSTVENQLNSTIASLHAIHRRAGQESDEHSTVDSTRGGTGADGDSDDESDVSFDIHAKDVILESYALVKLSDTVLQDFIHKISSSSATTMNRTIPSSDQLQQQYTDYLANDDRFRTYLSVSLSSLLHLTGIEVNELPLIHFLSSSTQLDAIARSIAQSVVEGLSQSSSWTSAKDILNKSNITEHHLPTPNPQNEQQIFRNQASIISAALLSHLEAIYSSSLPVVQQNRVITSDDNGYHEHAKYFDTNTGQLYYRDVDMQISQHHKSYHDPIYDTKIAKEEGDGTSMSSEDTATRTLDIHHCADYRQLYKELLSGSSTTRHPGEVGDSMQSSRESQQDHVLYPALTALNRQTMGEILTIASLFEHLPQIPHHVIHMAYIYHQQSTKPSETDTRDHSKSHTQLTPEKVTHIYQHIIHSIDNNQHSHAIRSLRAMLMYGADELSSYDATFILDHIICKLLETDEKGMGALDLQLQRTQGGSTSTPNLNNRNNNLDPQILLAYLSVFFTSPLSREIYNHALHKMVEQQEGQHITIPDTSENDDGNAGRDHVINSRSKPSSQEHSPPTHVDASESEVQHEQDDATEMTSHRTDTEEEGAPSQQDPPSKPTKQNKGREFVLHYIAPNQLLFNAILQSLFSDTILDPSLQSTSTTSPYSQNALTSSTATPADGDNDLPLGTGSIGRAPYPHQQPAHQTTELAQYKHPFCLLADQIVAVAPFLNAQQLSSYLLSLYTYGRYFDVILPPPVERSPLQGSNKGYGQSVAHVNRRSLVIPSLSPHRPSSQSIDYHHEHNDMNSTTQLQYSFAHVIRSIERLLPNDYRQRVISEYYQFIKPPATTSRRFVEKSKKSIKKVAIPKTPPPSSVSPDSSSVTDELGDGDPSSVQQPTQSKRKRPRAKRLRRYKSSKKQGPQDVVVSEVDPIPPESSQ